MKNRNFALQILLILVLGLTAAALNTKIASDHETKKHFVMPSKNIVQFTLGYDEMIADSMWLRLVQDMGICLQNQVKPGMRRTGPNRVTDCERGWTFRMIDVITDLAPKFNMAYFAGASSLSVAADDVVGAGIIYDKALKAFPNDWSLIYRAATHYLTEMGNEERAAELYADAANKGAPGWAVALSATLYSRMGKYKLARWNLVDFIKKNPDNRHIERAKLRLAEIEEAMESEPKGEHR